jgi:diguanylate cyclase (GGDEF)-like protein
MLVMQRMPADRTRISITSASYAALVGLGYVAYESLNIHIGTLSVLPLLFISYYTRLSVALTTALVCGVFFALFDHEVAHGSWSVPPVVDSVTLCASLCAVVLICDRLREASATNQLLRGRLISTRRAAERDSLTHLANRAYFMRRLNDLVRSGAEHGAVLFCDLDGFKAINDTYGHPVGDIVLTLAAGRLVNAVRADDLVARLGGDEFGVLVSRVNGGEEAQHMVANIERSFTDPFQLDARHFNVGITVGVSLFPADAQTIDALVRIADARMYQAKDVKKTARVST